MGKIIVQLTTLDPPNCHYNEANIKQVLPMGFAADKHRK